MKKSANAPRTDIAQEPVAATEKVKESKDKDAKAPKPVKEPKVRKPKLIRDSFTFPEADYALLAELKQRALAEGHDIKKSELLRAGLLALAAMPAKSFLARLSKVERIKTGRPGKA